MGAESAPKTAKWGAESAPKNVKVGAKSAPQFGHDKIRTEVKIKVGQKAPQNTKWGRKRPKVAKWGKKRPTFITEV